MTEFYRSVGRKPAARSPPTPCRPRVGGDLWWPLVAFICSRKPPERSDLGPHWMGWFRSGTLAAWPGAAYNRASPPCWTVSRSSLIDFMSDPVQSRNPFFLLAVVSAGLFIATILALVASVFGDPHAPLAKFLDRYAGTLLGTEVVATLATGFLALAVDRVQTLRAQSKSPK